MCNYNSCNTIKFIKQLLYIPGIKVFFFVLFLLEIYIIILFLIVGSILFIILKYLYNTFLHSCIHIFNI